MGKTNSNSSASSKKTTNTNKTTSSSKNTNTYNSNKTTSSNKNTNTYNSNKTTSSNKNTNTYNSNKTTSSNKNTNTNSSSYKTNSSNKNTNTYNSNKTNSSNKNTNTYNSNKTTSSNKNTNSYNTNYNKTNVNRNKTNINSSAKSEAQRYMEDFYKKKQEYEGKTNTNTTAKKNHTGLYTGYPKINKNQKIINYPSANWPSKNILKLNPKKTNINGAKKINSLIPNNNQKIYTNLLQNSKITSIKTGAGRTNMNTTFYKTNSNNSYSRNTFMTTDNVETLDLSKKLDKQKIDVSNIDLSRISASAQGAMDSNFTKINKDIWSKAQLNVTEREDGTYIIKNGDVPLGFTDKKGLESMLNPTPAANKFESSNDRSDKELTITGDNNNNVSNLTSDKKKFVPEDIDGKVMNIPDNIKQSGYTVTCYESDGWHLGGSSKATPIGKSSNQKLVNNLWNEQGSNYDNGIATMNVNGVDRYMVAVSQEIGKVGDVLNVKLKDGTDLPCVIADSKNRNDPNYTQYGHRSGSGINVLEFEVDTNKYNTCGNPGGDRWELDWDSSSPVTSINNIGSILDSPDQFSTKN